MMKSNFQYISNLKEEIEVRKNNETMVNNSIAVMINQNEEDMKVINELKKQIEVISSQFENEKERYEKRMKMMYQ